MKAPSLSFCFAILITTCLKAQTFEWTNFAGMPQQSGIANGTGSAARFDSPRGLDIAPDGTIYVAEEGNNVVRKITPSGVVSLLAGGLDVSGSFKDGTGPSARFYDPTDVAIGPDGNVYVADSSNHRIRKITPAGVVTTFAGTGAAGALNGPRASAQFAGPEGLAFDAAGNLYVADTGNDIIRKIDTTGTVSTLAGNPAGPGRTNGLGSAARFDFPQGITVGTDGYIYVADTDNHTIRKITPEGDVTTFAGAYYDDGAYPRLPRHVDDTGDAARFYNPTDLIMDAEGNLLVMDRGNFVIRKVTSEAVVTTFAGVADTSGDSVGSDSAVRFRFPSGIARNSQGHLYVGDEGNERILKWSPVQPGIRISGNGLAIPNGAAPAVTGNHTHFGTVNTNGGSKQSTFTITNTSTGALTLTGNPRVKIEGFRKEDYTVTIQPAATIAANGSTTFTLTFDPSNQGPRHGVAVIESDAANDSVFSFALYGDGEGVPPPDRTKPTLSVLTPKNNSVVYTSPLDVTGITSDDVDVTQVWVELDGEFIGSTAVRTETAPRNYTFKRTVNLTKVGKNSVRITSRDAENNIASVTHTFTYDPRKNLTVTRVVPAGLSGTPDLAGTITLKATPAKNAVLTQTGAAQIWAVTHNTPVSLTAVAKKGFLFSHWLGYPGSSQISGSGLTFTTASSHIPGVTATFVANPFVPPVSAPSTPATIQWGTAPILSGLIQPAGATAAGNGAVAHVTVTVVPTTAAISGKVQMDGQLTPFKGVLQGNGVVLFNLGKNFSPELALKGNSTTPKKISLATWNASGIFLTIQPNTATPAQVITGTLLPATYHKLKLIPAELNLLNLPTGKGGYYTLAFPPRTGGGAQPSSYPQGIGYGTLSLTNLGALKLAGVLADGTKITASSFLVGANNSPFFIPLTTPGGRNKDGSLLGYLDFAATAGHDISSTGWRWIRPAALGTKIKLYTAGWPNGLFVEARGARYDASRTVQQTLNLPAESSSGNAQVIFEEGKLKDGFVSAPPFNIAASKVVKLAVTPAFTLTIVPKTGIFKGTFTPVWEDPLKLDKKLPAFEGVLFQKDLNEGLGFFISNQKNDLAPESGPAIFSKKL